MTILQNLEHLITYRQSHHIEQHHQHKDIVSSSNLLFTLLLVFSANRMPHPLPPATAIKHSVHSSPPTPPPQDLKPANISRFTLYVTHTVQCTDNNYDQLVKTIHQISSQQHNMISRRSPPSPPAKPQSPSDPSGRYCLFNQAMYHKLVGDSCVCWVCTIHNYEIIFMPLWRNNYVPITS